MFYNYVTRSGSGIRVSQWNKWIDDPYKYSVRIEADGLLTKLAVLFLTEEERQTFGDEKYKYRIPTGWLRRPNDGYTDPSLAKPTEH